MSEDKLSVQNNKLLWWLMGLVATLLVGLAGSWGAGLISSVDKVTTAVDKTNENLERNTKELRQVVAMNSERIVKVETYNDMQRQQMADLQRAMVRVETKVDELGRK